MSNEWRSVDGDKWRDVVRRVVDIYNSKHLEEWEVLGQIAYEFEKVVAEQTAEIERLRKALDELRDIGDRIYQILIHPTASVTAFETWELGDALKLSRGEKVDRPFKAKAATGVASGDNRPPDRVVQNVVQDAGEGGGTDV